MVHIVKCGLAVDKAGPWHSVSKAAMSLRQLSLFMHTTDGCANAIRLPFRIGKVIQCLCNDHSYVTQQHLDTLCVGLCGVVYCNLIYRLISV